MMKRERRRVVLTSLLVICIIGAIIVYKVREPKNLFEEIYAAEIHAARTRKPTPLIVSIHFGT
jgi:cytochrome c-type biogenesis protein CcmE